MAKKQAKKKVSKKAQDSAPTEHPQKIMSVVVSDAKQPEPEQYFHHKDVRILREAMSKMGRKAPPIVQGYLHQQLKQFAMAIRSYCQCPERAHVPAEGKYACLFCGKRHEPKSRDHLKQIK